MDNSSPPFGRPQTHADTFLRDQAREAGLSIGQVLLGRYEIRRVLGQGAMGQVLEVRDRQSGNDYALKRVPPELVRDQAQMEGIRANFALVSQLAHPHIAGTRHLELDPATGHAYLLLDLVRGLDLSQWVAQKRSEAAGTIASLPIGVVLGIAEQVASALDYAHSQPVSRGADGRPKRYGILHRDLKPANVMVETSREYRSGVPYVRLVDFGLAAEIQASLQSVSIVGQNKVAGTPVYMAPEQWEGRTLTRGVDQWALAVMIYEIASGRRPFDGPTESAVMTLVREANPEPPSNFSKGQWQALKQTFSVDRRQRYRSCVGLVKALAGAERSTTGSIVAAEMPMPEEFDGVSTGPRGQSKGAGDWIWKVSVAAMLLLVAFGYGGWRYREGAIREEIAQAATKAEGSRTATGAELASALKDAEEVRLRYAQRDPNELSGLDAALAALKARKTDLDGREARFNRLIEEAGKVEGTDPELALQKLMDAEDVGKPSTTRGYPDLLAATKPSLDERKTAARTAWEGKKKQAAEAEQAKKKAEQETEESRKKALEGLAGLKVLVKQMEDSKNDLRTKEGSDALVNRLLELCERYAFGGSKRLEADKAYAFGETLVTDRRYLDAAEQFSKAEPIYQAALKFRLDAEDLLRGMESSLQKLSDGTKELSAEEHGLYAAVEQSLRDAEASLGSGDVLGAKGALEKAKQGLPEAATIVSHRREVQEAWEQVAGLSDHEEFKGAIAAGDRKLKESDGAAGKSDWAVAKAGYADAKSKFEAVFGQAKQKVDVLLTLAKGQHGKKQYDVALQSLGLILQVEPAHSEAKALKAVVERDRAYEEALTEARNLLEREEQDKDGRYAKVDDAMRKKVDELLAKAQELKPGDAAAKTLQEKLGWPYWDGKESMAEYAKRCGLEATKTLRLNGESLEMVLVPAGKFTMGSPETEADRSGDENQHEVTLTEPYYMGKYEVTQAQWEAVMGSNPSVTKGRSYPVENLSWHDIQGFLSRAENGLKLPTEAQWEYACRAGTKTRFYTGDSDADLALAGWCTIAEAIQPVGRKHPNAFGLYDMHGNMWEWCADWYGAYADGAVKNPTGPATGELRVLRSGSWDHGPRSCRAARRNYSTPTGRDDCRGFRVVVVASSQTP